MGLFSRAQTKKAESDVPAREPPQLPPDPPTDSLGRRTPDVHVGYLLDAVSPLAPFGMSLMDAWGRVLCEDIKADADIPPYPVAEVDGYGIRYAELSLTPIGGQPVFIVTGGPRHAVDGLAPAEDAAEPASLTPPPSGVVGRAVRLRIGDALPEGIDTVLSSDQATIDASGHYVAVTEKVGHGDWVRPTGTESRVGEVVLAAGTALDDAHSALLAAVGFDHVMARPRTRVAAVHMFDSQAETELSGGRTNNGGLLFVSGAAQADGAAVWRLDVDLATPGIARQRVNDELIRTDLVLTIGGLTDAGPDPRLLQLLNEMGVAKVAEVSMRPGRMHGFGLIGDENIPVIMLPSDPIALMVAYHAFARPVLRKMMGVLPIKHEPVLCFAEHDMDAGMGVTQYTPCKLRQEGSRYLAAEIAPRNHSWLTTLVATNAIVILPPNRQRVYSGEALGCWLLSTP